MPLLPLLPLLPPPVSVVEEGKDGGGGKVRTTLDVPGRERMRFARKVGCAEGWAEVMSVGEGRREMVCPLVVEVGEVVM